MSEVFSRTLLAVFGLAVSSAVFAQLDQREAERQAELERQQIFLAGFQAIVEDLNSNSFERFALAIDQENMLERILGLRLIDQKVQKGFSEEFAQNLPNILKAAFGVPEGKMRAAWLGFGSKGDRGKAIVRYDLPEFQFNYHEYELRLDDKGRVIIVDWVDFLSGEKFSDGIGITLVSLNPGKPAVRKLLDFQGPTDQQVFQLTELLKASRDNQVDRYFDILDDLDERLRSQRVVVLTSVQLTRAVRDRRKLRKALIDVDEYFPEDPLFSLMLIDYYFPTRRYQDAMDALLRLQARLRVQDAAMSARLSAASLVLENNEDALSHAETAVQIEPGLELGWWSVLRARVTLEQFEGAVEALDELEKQFGYTLGADSFDKDPLMAPLLRSEEFESWYLANE